MFDKALLRLAGMKGVLGMLAAFALAQAALAIGQALALSQALASLWAGASLAGQFGLLAAFLACFAGRHAIATGQDALLDRFATRICGNLRERLLNVALAGDATLMGSIGTAAVTTAATEGADQVARYVRVIPPKLCGLAGICLPVLVALFAIDWVSGVIALAAFPIIMMFMVMLGKQARTRAERQYEASTRLSNHFLDSLRGIEAIDSLGAVEREAAGVHRTSERLRMATVRTLSVATLSSAVLDLIAVFGVAAIAMMLAFRLLDGSMQLAPALNVLMLAPEFFAPIRSFAGDFHASLDGKNALASILGILDEAQPVAAEEEPFPPWGPDSRLSASGVGYAYPGASAPALRDVSFCCEGFEKIALVGASGAGKSTLANLLAGLRAPAAGSFEVDGVAAGSLCAASWTSQVHYVPQSPHIFDGTLLENIRFYRPDATLPDVERAIDAVGLGPLVAELPDGLDTRIGAGARGLSGGQAHRIALARILVDDRKIVVFDEPTAHLDIQTELELKGRMLRCMEGRLVIMATHRLHWLDAMDQVIVLENGTIAQAGDPAALLACDGPLKRLAYEMGAGVTS